MMKREALEFAGVRVGDFEFGGLIDATFCLYKGETIGLAGLITSGKITLLNILSGSVSGYEGKILIGGQAVQLGGYTSVWENGITFVSDTPRLFDNLSISDNIYIPLGRKTLLSVPEKSPEKQIILEWADILGVDLGKKTTNQLTRFEKTKIEILKAVVSKARIIVFSQIFMFCNEEEARELSAIIKSLNEESISVIIEHDDFFPLFADAASRCVVVRGGMVTNTIFKDENGLFDEEKIRHAIVGRSFEKRHISPGATGKEEGGDPFLKIVRLDTGGEIHSAKGAVVGFYDAAETLPRTVDGLMEQMRTTFHVFINNTLFLPKKVSDLVAQRIAVISKEAADQPIFYNLSPVENVCMFARQLLGRRMIYSRQTSEYLYDQVVKKYKVLRHCADLRGHKDCYELLYERQYELMLAKWLVINPQIVVIYAPMNNMDTKNYERYREWQMQLVQDRKTVIIISSNFDALESVCTEIHRI